MNTNTNVNESTSPARAEQVPLGGLGGQKLTVEYPAAITKWLVDWDLTPEQNEDILQQLASGKLTDIWVGCDTGRMAIRNCFALHGDQYMIGSSWSAYCQLCHTALQNLPLVRFYDGHRIEFAVNVAEAQAQLAKVKAELDEQKRQRQAAAEKQKKDFDALVAIAKATGQRQQLEKYCEACNGDVDDCDVDEVIVYVNGKGQREYERVHTY